MSLPRVVQAAINQSPAPALFEVRGLSVSYCGTEGAVRAARDISLEIAARDILALVGETGCGKSTVALALLGLLDPGRTRQQGGIRFHGRPAPAPADERAWRTLRGPSVAMVFQDPRGSLNPVLTIGAQLLDAMRAHGRVPRREARQRPADLLARVGLPDPAFWMRRYPYELSGGMCQRVGIALAVCNRPALLVADEPTSALDPTVRAQILALLEEMNRDGLAILLISHDLELVAHHARRVAVMYHGRIVEIGPAREIIEAPRHPYTQGLVRAIPGLAQALPGQRLEPIPGTPPGAAVELPGCAFAPRCRIAGPDCVAAEPAVEPVSPGHDVACWKIGRG